MHMPRPLIPVEPQQLRDARGDVVAIVHADDTREFVHLQEPADEHRRRSIPDITTCCA